MNAATKIFKTLNPIFAELDAQLLEKSIESALNRKRALAEFKASDEVRGKSVWSWFNKASDIAGGKTWYNLFTGHGDNGVIEFVTKNCAAKAGKRNAKIAVALEKAGVTDVTGEAVAMTHDGFDGIFEVVTDKGAKRVIIESSWVAGYNIVCHHLRVNVKVK